MTFAADLLQKAGVLAIPGLGYGEQGDGYVRLSLTVGGDEERRANSGGGSAHRGETDDSLVVYPILKSRDEEPHSSSNMRLFSCAPFHRNRQTVL